MGSTNMNAVRCEEVGRERVASDVDFLSDNGTSWFAKIYWI